MVTESPSPSRSSRDQQRSKSDHHTLARSLYVVTLVPVTLAGSLYTLDELAQAPWLRFGYILATVLFFASGLLWRVSGRLGLGLGTIAILVALIASVPGMIVSPTACLAILAAGMTGLYALSAHYRRARAYWRGINPEARAAGYGAVIALLLSVAAWESSPSNEPLAVWGAAIACLVSGILTWVWARTTAIDARSRYLVVGSCFFVLVCMLLALTVGRSALLACLVCPLVVLRTLSFRRGRGTGDGLSLLRALLEHPSRLPVTVFLGLIAIGSLIMALPLSSATDAPLDSIDAVFTAASAVCVTGLIVVDTPNDLSPFGQGCVLMLIQAGGLGIMALSTAAFQAFGGRMSIGQERALADLSLEDRGHLREAFPLVLKYTLISEFLGVLTLWPQFVIAGDSIPFALVRAVFTSISAFCNAGFALQSDSLVGYQDMPGVLHVIAVLIILGSTSPLVMVAVPRWFAGRSVPVLVKLVTVTNFVLLGLGLIVFSVFEWNGVLGGLEPIDRIHNAWLQSVTRTAGFNSVSISEVSDPTLMLILALMVIGGSPGSTAGGMKTTTFAVLLLGSIAVVRGRLGFNLDGRRIGRTTILKALAVASAGLAFWTASVVTLMLTQKIPFDELVFEVTSALGTVGLSIGGTERLDDAGKAIVIAVMFIGRVGPLALFGLLNEQEPAADAVRPEANIPIS